MIWRDIYVASTAAYLPPRDASAVNTSSPFHAALGYTSATIARPSSGLSMAARAALLALQQSGHTADELSLLTLAAAFPNDTYVTPVCHIQRILRADQAHAVDLGAASTGDLAGLVAAAEHLTANPTAQVALAVATSCLAGTDRHASPDYTMSDGAAALVLSRRPGHARLLTTAYAAAPHLEALTYLNLTPQQRKAAVDALPIPLLTTLRDKTTQTVARVLDEADTSINKVARIVVHGAGFPFLTTVFAQPLGIDLTATTWPFHRQTGHVGPCDHFLGLDHLLRTDPALKEGDRILIVGMGVGWRWICVVLELTRSGAQR